MKPWRHMEKKPNIYGISRLRLLWIEFMVMNSLSQCWFGGRMIRCRDHTDPWDLPCNSNPPAADTGISHCAGRDTIDIRRMTQFLSGQSNGTLSNYVIWFTYSMSCVCWGKNSSASETSSCKSRQDCPAVPLQPCIVQPVLDLYSDSKSTQCLLGCWKCKWGKIQRFHPWVVFSGSAWKSLKSARSSGWGKHGKGSWDMEHLSHLHGYWLVTHLPKLPKLPALSHTFIVQIHKKLPTPKFQGLSHPWSRKAIDGKKDHTVLCRPHHKLSSGSWTPWLGQFWLSPKNWALWLVQFWLSSENWTPNWSDWKAGWFPASQSSPRQLSQTLLWSLGFPVAPSPKGR